MNEEQKQQVFNELVSIRRSLKRIADVLLFFAILTILAIVLQLLSRF